MIGSGSIGIGTLDDRLDSTKKFCCSKNVISAETKFFWRWDQSNDTPFEFESTLERHI